MVRLAILAGAAALLSTSAVAQTPPPGGGMMGGMQGPQTLEASQARQDMMFDQLDADHDGALTAGELSGLSRMMPQGAGRMRGMIARADVNNDARITRDELRIAGEARFRAMDKNGDGVISAEERPQMPAQAPAMPAMPQGPGSTDPSQWPGGVPSDG